MKHDRNNELSELPDRRVADRRISPAIGEFAIQQIPPLAAEIDRLREELLQCRAKLALAAESAAGDGELISELLAALSICIHEMAYAGWGNVVARMSRSNAIQTARAAIAKGQTESAAAQASPSVAAAVYAAPASAADHKPEAA